MPASSATVSNVIAPEPVSILFVCLGNICRSPMAEAVFHALTHQHPLIARIDSCGTGAYHVGAAPDSRTLSVLADHSITSYTHAARKVSIPQDFTEFDYVLAMDEENVEDLRDFVKRAVRTKLLRGAEVDKIHLYGEFGGKSKDEEVGDPYYGGRDGFETAYQQVTRFAKGLLKHVEERASNGK